MESAATAIGRPPPARLFTALLRLGDALLCVLPLAFAVEFVFPLLRGYHGFDFVVFWHAGRDVLAGHSPYPALASLPKVANHQAFAPFVYPAPFAVAVAPLALLPLPVASSLFTVLALAAVAGSLRLLGVRDWRCYAAAFSSFPVMSAIMLGTVTPFLLLGAAALWRWRNRPLVAGSLLAALVVTKVFLWPLGFWLLATRRYRATAWSVVLSVGAALAGWAAIGFAGLTAYPGLMRALTSLVGGEGFSPYALVRAAGGSPSAATLATFAAGAALAAAVFRAHGERRAFTLALAAALAFSPVVWPHYLALLLVPVALTSRRLSLHWLAPIVFWFFAHGWSDGRLDRIVPVLALTACVVAATALQAGGESSGCGRGRRLARA
jgi:hypothetical protein